MAYIECSALTGYGKEKILNEIISDIQYKIVEKANFDKSIKLQERNFLYKDDCC